MLRAVQNGLLSILGILAGDLFQTIHIPPRSQYLHTLSLPSLKYSEDLILSEVGSHIHRRPPEKERLALLNALNDGVVATSGIFFERSDDHALRDPR